MSHQHLEGHPVVKLITPHEQNIFSSAPLLPSVVLSTTQLLKQTGVPTGSSQFLTLGASIFVRSFQPFLYRSRDSFSSLFPCPSLFFSQASLPWDSFTRASSLPYYLQAPWASLLSLIVCLPGSSLAISPESRERVLCSMAKCRRR
jgi:hypothetical protein